VTARILIVFGFLVAAAFAPWAVRRLIGSAKRPDGTPSPLLTRWVATANVAFILLAIVLSRHNLLVPARLWRNDAWTAVLFGSLGGLLLHFLGSGSPLPVAALTGSRRRLRSEIDVSDLISFASFAIGEISGIIIWFGAGLPTLLRLMPRLLALPLVAGGYGLGRAAAGQDHPITGAIDGLLLGLLYLLSGSFIAVLLAQVIVDVLAYVSAANAAEDEAMDDKPFVQQRSPDL
jgi:hypothetical protein